MIFGLGDWALKNFGDRGPGHVIQKKQISQPSLIVIYCNLSKKKQIRWEKLWNSSNKVKKWGHGVSSLVEWAEMSIIACHSCIMIPFFFKKLSDLPEWRVNLTESERKPKNKQRLLKYHNSVLTQFVSWIFHETLHI